MDRERKTVRKKERKREREREREKEDSWGEPEMLHMKIQSPELLLFFLFIYFPTKDFCPENVQKQTHTHTRSKNL